MKKPPVLRTAPALVAFVLMSACSGITSGPRSDAPQISPVVRATDASSGEAPAISEAHSDAQQANGRTSLHLAVIGGRTETVRHLLREGANPDAVDGGGASSAFLALQRNDDRMLSLLLKHGADPNFINTLAGAHVKVYSPGVLWTNMEERPLNCRTKPLEGGLFQFVEAKSLLELAIANDSISQVDALVTAGANLDAQDCYGNTALRTAIVLGRFEIANRLLEAGAEPSITNRWGVSLLETARSRGIGDSGWRAIVIDKLRIALAAPNDNQEK